ncbi:MAG: hemerythrin domain-containing protein [Kofleriaceae bacterium]
MSDATNSNMTIRTRMMMDHEDLSADLDELIRTFELGDWALARTAYNAVESRLKNHLAAEEELLFPELARVSPHEVAELLDEHRALRKRLEEVGIGVDVHQANLGAIRELAQDVRRHAAREDALLYRWADRELDQLATLSRFENLFVHGRSPAPPAGA